MRVSRRHLIAPPTRARAKSALWAIMVAPSDEDAVTKTGLTDDTVIVGEINKDRSWLNDLVKELYWITSPREPVFTIAYRRFAELIASASSAAGLDSLALTPHTLRHGGASTDALADIDLEKIQRRGRWMTNASTRRYEKKGRIMKQVSKLSDEQLTMSDESLSFLRKQLPQLLRRRINRRAD